MTSISAELSKLAEELAGIEAEINGARAYFDGVKQELVSVEAEFAEAKRQLDVKNDRKSDLLKRVASLVSVESASTVQKDSSLTSGILSRPVSDLELSVRALNCLAVVEEIHYVGDLVQFSEQAVLSISNIGRKSFNEIKEVLAVRNLCFGMKIDSWQRPESPS